MTPAQSIQHPKPHTQHSLASILPFFNLIKRISCQAMWGPIFFYLIVHHQYPSIFWGHPVVICSDYCLICHHINTPHVPIQSLGDGHLGCFWSFTVIKDIMNQLVHISSCTSLSVSLGYILKNETAK